MGGRRIELIFQVRKVGAGAGRSKGTLGKSVEIIWGRTERCGKG